MDKSGFLTTTLVLVVVLAAVSAQQRPGACPPPTGVAVCSKTCSADDDCVRRMKCCPTACGGTACSLTVTARTVGAARAKSGSCPASPTGPWVCSNRCTSDVDCRGRLKCCRNRCGAMACQKPESAV